MPKKIDWLPPDQLKNVRTGLRLSQAEFAALGRVHVSTVQRLESETHPGKDYRSRGAMANLVAVAVAGGIKVGPTSITIPHELRQPRPAGSKT